MLKLLVPSQLDDDPRGGESVDIVVHDPSRPPSTDHADADGLIAWANLATRLRDCATAPATPSVDPDDRSRRRRGHGRNLLRRRDRGATLGREDLFDLDLTTLLADDAPRSVVHVDD